MGLGISLINDTLLKTGLRMACRDKNAQIQTTPHDLLTRIRLPGRDHGSGNDSQVATLIVPRRSMGYYELTTQDSRPVKLETLIVNELAQLRKRVEGEAGRRFDSCCSAVPPCYFDMQRSALREIVQQCGIAEVTLLNEPVALLKTLPEDGRYLVACLEDGMFYLSLLARSGENIVELANGGDPKWGGVELIHALSQQAVQPRSGLWRSVRSEQWKQGFGAAHAILTHLLDGREVPAEIRGFVSEFTSMTRKKIANELERLLTIGKQRPQDIPRCLLIGAYWNLPDMKKAFDTLVSVRFEWPDADRIAQGALLASEEREARAPRPITLPPGIMPAPAAEAPDEAAETPPADMHTARQEEEEKVGPLQPASIFLLTDYSEETPLALPTQTDEQRETPTLSHDDRHEAPPAFDMPPPVRAQATLPRTDQDAVSHASFDIAPLPEARTSPLSAEALAALIQQAGTQLDAAQGVEFYQLLLTKTRQLAAEHCLREAAKAAVINDMTTYIKLLREGYAFDPGDGSIGRRLADVCCDQCERCLQDPKIAVPLHWVDQALKYAPQHKRARELKAYLQGRRGGSMRSSRGR